MKSNLLGTGMLLGLPVLALLRVLPAGYIAWDDYRLVVDNPLMNAPLFSALGGIWGGFIEGDYTPLPHTTYLLEILLWGKSGPLHHVINLLFHLINILLLQKLLTREGLSAKLTFLITLVFAIHPLQVESVAWISDRNNLMNGSCVLMACYALQNARIKGQPWRWHFAYAGFMLLAALCKATAIFLPLSIGLTLWWSGTRRRGALLAGHVAVFAAVSLPLAVVRREALLNKVGGWDIGSLGDRLNQLLVMIPTALGHYLKCFFWPLRLSAVYSGFAQMAMTEWLPLCLAGGAMVVGWALFVAMRRDFCGRLSFFWFFGLLAPVLNIFPRAIFVNDRYMYLPLIGLTYGVCAMAGAFVPPLFAKLTWPKKRLAPNFFATLGWVLLVGALFAISWQRAVVWSDDYLFWGDVTRKTPQSPLGWNNLAMTAKAGGLYPEAQNAVQRALELPLDPTSPRHVLWANLGDLYLLTEGWPAGHDPAKALGAYRSALAEDGGMSEATRALLLLKISVALMQTGRGDEARGVLQRLVAPDSPATAEVRADAARILGELARGA